MKLGVKGPDIDDVIQEVMLGFFSHIPTFVYDPAKGRFRGYLKVCTFRAMTRKIGRQARFKGVPLEQVDPEMLEIDQSWNDVWEQEQLKRAVEMVRQQYKGSRTFLAFERTAIAGEDVNKVAADLGLSIDGVYKAKARVTEALRERMKVVEEDLG
jgi:RNA polymerase sigma factor (sigma-70 family)